MSMLIPILRRMGPIDHHDNRGGTCRRRLRAIVDRRLAGPIRSDPDLIPSPHPHRMRTRGSGYRCPADVSASMRLTAERFSAN
jgi:hypothetical protein